MALLGAAALCAALTGSGAASPGKLRQRPAALAARESSATLELYAIRSQLARTEARLDALRVRREALEGQLTRLRIELDVAWRSLYFAQERLGGRIRQLYEHGQLDPVAVLLGAESLDEAIEGLEGLRSLAAGDREILREVRAARAQIAAATQRVSSRVAALRSAEDAAASNAAALRETAAERLAFIDELAAERRLTNREIRELETVARSAATKSTTIAPLPASDGYADSRPETAPPVIEDGMQLTVLATGYAIRGRTATGIPTVWGVVAVDPSVIPLGTRMTIPGYGEGVAADTGGSVRGNAIDLWFPTTAQALAWGRRTVTITLHG